MRYNSDGIDMHNREDVVISNCFIRTFDDCLCVKGFDPWHDFKNIPEGNYDVFKNVIVRDCVLWNDWGKCLEIGAETRAEEIYNIVFENCEIIHASNAVLDCLNVDYADVHDVVFQNINIFFDDVMPMPLLQKTDSDKYENKDLEFSPVLINIEIMNHFEYSYGGEKRGINRNFLFKNISLFSRQQPFIRFAGYSDQYKCSNITIENFYHNGKKLIDFANKEINEFCENIVIK